MLYDCNLVEDEEKNRNKEYILNLFEDVIPWRTNEDGEEDQWIDIFVNSHRDTDHLRGLKDLNCKFPIHSIWDSGQSGASIGDSNYQYYMGLRNRLKQKDESNLVVPTPSDAVFRTYGDADVYCQMQKTSWQSHMNQCCLRRQIEINIRIALCY